METITAAAIVSTDGRYVGRMSLSSPYSLQPVAFAATFDDAAKARKLLEWLESNGWVGLSLVELRSRV